MDADSLLETAPEEASDTRTIQLAGQHSLSVDTTPQGNVLRVHLPDGRAGLSIHITAAGISLRVAGERLELEAEGALHLRAEELVLHGKNKVAISTDGDASLCAGGDLSIEASAQSIKARLGDVEIKANDDVRLNGERVRLNT